MFEQSQEQKKKEAGVKELQAQSKAVHLLLALLHRFPPLTITFAHMQGYEMLAVVLFTFLKIIIVVVLFYWYLLCSRKANFYVIHRQ